MSRPLRSMLLILCAAITTVATAQRTKHWVGGSGNWSDPQHWSGTAGGPGGIGVPESREAVTIAPANDVTITIDDDAFAGQLTLDGTRASVRVEGGDHPAMRIDGDWRMLGDVTWSYLGTIELKRNAGGSELDLRGTEVAGNMVVDGGGVWNAISDIRVAGELLLKEGTFVTNGIYVHAATLRASTRSAKALLAGSAVFDVDQFIYDGQRAFVEPGSSHLIINGVTTPWGRAAHGEAEMARGINICGTGVGQTPFTINAQTLTNFNGFNISCNGACDGVVTVTLTGGIGPFIFAWQNGGPATQTWSNVCAGTRLVIVTDLGQGVGCAASVQVSEPPPLGIIFFPPPTPPTCAEVCNGTASVLVVGGVPAYTYDWNNGAGTNSSFNGLCAGPNPLVVHDMNNCQADTVITINLQPITPNLVFAPAQCNGVCDGTAQVTPTGGTGTYSYNWEPGSPQGEGTDNVFQLCPGNYTVTITDVNGCDTTVAFQITQPPPIIPNAVITNATCADACDGDIILTPSGAVGPYQYIWTPPVQGQFTNHAQNLCPGTYDVTIIDSATGCDTLVSITITSPPPIIPNGGSTNVTCAGACDGTAIVNPTGGTPGFTFVWTPTPPVGQNTNVASQLCAGVWSVTITDLAGCDTTVQFTITAPPPIVPNEAHTDVTCNGDCDGTATVAPTGGAGTFVFDWAPGSPIGDGTPNISQLCAGIYTVTITDVNGCDTTVSVTILEPPPIDAVETITNVSCGNLCDGAIDLVVSGGSPGYTYVWTPAPGGGQGTPNVTGLCAGSYSVLITDDNGCTITRNFDVLAPVPMSVSLLPTNATCPNVCDGTATATVTGGTTPYQYNWAPPPGGGQGTNAATGLCPGNYLLTVTDSVGCDTTIQFTIASPLPIVPNPTVTDPTCSGDCNGTITVAPTGGNGTFSYVWSPEPGGGQNTATATGLCAGTWQVTITSGACDTTLTFDLTAPPPITANLVITPPTCASSCDATASAPASGGTPNYTYTWSPAPGAGQGTPNATQMCPGSYTLTIADALGCDTVIAFTITAPPPIQASVVTTLASCGGLCDGTATLTASGGSGSLTITWAPPPGAGQGTLNATQMCPGAYTVTIADSLGCDTTLTFAINTPSGISSIPQVTPASCADVCDGTIVLTTSGGQPPYSYAWSPAPPINNGSSVGGLCGGDWTVVISDQADCDTVLVINVPAPTPIIPNGVFTNESCNGPCDGTADVNPSGGAGNYTYVWTPQPGTGQGTASVTGLCAGNWSVVITDASGCDTTWSFTVLPQQPIVPNLTFNDGTCFGACNGDASVAPTGGIGGFTYLWTPTPGFGQGTANVGGLCIGQWSVTITDASGCDTTVTFLISKPSAIVPNLVVANATCFGPCTGEADVTPTGGMGGFTYLWQPDPGSGQGTSSADGLCADSTYTITITDANLCDTTITFVVPPFVPITPNGSSVAVTCNGACDGAIAIAPTGGEAPYTYVWSPQPPIGQGTTSVGQLCAGTWDVTITDANGCDTTVSFLIVEPPVLTPGATTQNISCNGACDGEIHLNVSGGNGGYTYVWSPVPSNGLGTPDAIDLCPGTWNVTIADANGCDTTLSFDITEPAALVATPAVVQSQCQQCNGSITLSVSGGSPGYTFNWGPPLNLVTTDSVVSNLCAGIYSVLISDSAGCSIQLAVPISDSDGEVVATTDGLTTCPATCDGSVSVSFNCALPTCTIAWFDGLGTDLNQSTNTVTNLCAGTYFVEVTNGNGCLTIDTANVIAPTAITALSSTLPVSCAGVCDGAAAIGISGGVPPYDVQWSPAPGTGQGTTNVTGLCAGVYDALITDDSGCQLTVAVLILGPAPIAANAVVDPISCSGQCDASITLNASGGTGTLNYLWDPVPPNGQGTTLADQLCPGTWNVTISDGNTCDTTFSFTIVDPQPVQIAVTTTPSQCLVCNGTATANVSGGTGTITITWTDPLNNPIGSGPSLIGLCAGVYIATATDANGCTDQTSVAVTDAVGEVLTVTDGQTTCANNCDGSVSVSFVCANGPCDITWYDGNGAQLVQNQFAITNLCIGMYLVEVTNGAGCTTIDTAQVVPSTVIIPNLGTQAEFCAGACDGAAVVGPVGGVAPYTYVWSPQPGGGQGTPLATGLCAGVYTVQITDSLGCDTLVNALILGPSPLAILPNVSMPACNGVCDGSIDISVFGGTGTYTYVWQPQPAVGQGTASVSQLCAGDWSVTVTDGNGCDSTWTFTITEPPAITLNNVVTPSQCNLCVGTAQTVVSGGTPGYSYSWSLNGGIFSTDSLATGLCAGLYTLLVTDASGCQVQEQVAINDSNGELVTATSDTVTCGGDCDGVVSASFNCVVPICTVAWFDGIGTLLPETGTTLDSLCAGPYYVQVTNGDGCITLDTAMVITPPPIQPNMSTSPALCNGSCDGSATVAPTGGDGDYTYVWDPEPGAGQGTGQATGLCAGTYDVTITDGLGCSIVASALIFEPTPVIADAVIDSISCNGICDATITLNTQGGNGQYSWTWAPAPQIGQGTPVADSLCAGIWSVVIQDVTGCDTTYTFSITEPAAITPVITTTNNLCFGDCAGIASVNISGGVAPYAVVWTNNVGDTIAQGDTIVTGLCAGDYSFTITDAHGCVYIEGFTITEGSELLPGLSFQGETCNGPCDGTASVAPSGGAGGYLYNWVPEPGGGQGTPIATGLCTGNWSVTITDAVGCDTTVSFTILPYAPIIPNATITDLACNDQCIGAITVAPTGGIGQYSYVWVPNPPVGQGTNSVGSLCAGNWSVTITDQVNCDTTITFTVNEPPPVVIIVDQVAPASCNTANDGSISISISGGTPLYQTVWSGPNNFTSQDEDLTLLFPGFYTVQVFDANLCLTTLTVEVPALTSVIADAGNDTTMCYGNAVVLDGSDSQGGASYQWTDGLNNPVGFTSTVNLGVLQPGTYTFTLAVINGPCVATDGITITILPLPFANAGPDQDIFVDATIALGGQPSGPPGSAFYWMPDSLVSDPAAQNPTTSPPTTTWFVLLVTSPEGCSSIDSVLITVIPEVVIPSGFTPNGDGSNDAWQIDFMEQFPNCTVEIYNRWGELLFTSVGYQEPWDGTYSGGVVPTGTYYYAIELNDERFPEPYTGPLTVIR